MMDATSRWSSCTNIHFFSLSLLGGNAKSAQKLKEMLKSWNWQLQLPKVQEDAILFGGKRPVLCWMTNQLNEIGILDKNFCFFNIIFSYRTFFFSCYGNAVQSWWYNCDHISPMLLVCSVEASCVLLVEDQLISQDVTLVKQLQRSCQVFLFSVGLYL